MKKFLPVFLCAAMFAVAVSCSKDDDKGDDLATGTKSYVGTVSVDQTDGTFFHDEDVTIDITFNEAAMTFDMKVNQVQFAAAMPIKLDMTVKGIAYTETNGTVSFTGDGLIPEAMGGPFPGYTITNLSGTITATQMSFSMICGRFPTSFSGTAKILP